MATHARILAWRIPWTEEPGGGQSTTSQSWTQLKRLSTHIHDITDGLNIPDLPCHTGRKLWKLGFQFSSDSFFYYFTDFTISLSSSIRTSPQSFSTCGRMWRPSLLSNASTTKSLILPIRHDLPSMNTDSTLYFSSLFIFFLLCFRLMYLTQCELRLCLKDTHVSYPHELTSYVTD